ncbi:hypothetical protein PG990_014893 [Apiospora arundinis]|uniref:Uncharacterized protein n=1 Tax=Apiospora arundinis TaxID=335852 RepID=A0ABR2HKI3_9PEZI
MGIWSKIPAVGQFCEDPEGWARIACVNLVPPPFVLAAKIALFVWFLPDLMILTTNALAFVYLKYRRFRHGY